MLKSRDLTNRIVMKFKTIMKKAFELELICNSEKLFLCTG